MPSGKPFSICCSLSRSCPTSTSRCFPQARVPDDRARLSNCEVPALHDTLAAVNREFGDGKVDAVYLCYTKFINTMKQEPVVEQLLPLSAEQLEGGAAPSRSWDYIYEPSAPAVIDELVLRYVEALVYQATAENLASEQSARMVAMKSATDNAGNVISELKLVYNKTRQAAITKELSEIVAGAAAV